MTTLGGFGSCYTRVATAAGASNREPIDQIDNSPVAKGPQTQEDHLNETRNKEFAEIMHSLLGIAFVLGRADRGATDCSGTIILALREMGYNVGRETVGTMTSGEVYWITLNPVVDNDPAVVGSLGMLNFYALDDNFPGRPTHVNVGVGVKGLPKIFLERRPQVVDATLGNTLVGRNEWDDRFRRGHFFDAGERQVNQTFAPFSTIREPVFQGTINWAVLEDRFRR